MEILEAAPAESKSKRHYAGWNCGNVRGRAKPHAMTCEMTFARKKQNRRRTGKVRRRSIEWYSDLLRERFFAGVLDATTTELADELVGGVLSAGPDRLEAAGRAGAPEDSRRTIHRAPSGDGSFVALSVDVERGL